MIKIFDKIVLRVGTFALLFMWTTYFTKNETVSALFAFSVTALLFFFIKPKQKTDEKLRNAFLKYLITSGKEEVFRLAQLASPADYEIRDGFLIDGKTALWDGLCFAELNDDYLIRIDGKAKKLGLKKVFVMVAKPVQSVILPVLSTETVFVSVENFMQKLIEKDLMPQIPEKFLKEKKVLRLFSLKNSGYYFVSACFLAIISFFTPFKLYYTISASVLLAFSLIPLFFKQFNEKYSQKQAKNF